MKVLMASCILVGPSHVHPAHADETVLKEYNKVMEIEAHCGMCNFSMHCLDVLTAAVERAKGRPVVWVVIDWRCGNYDHADLNEHGITNTPSKPGNISAEHITPNSDSFLIDVQRQIIHKHLKTWPNLRVVFWCCYVRTVLGSSWKYEGTYNSIMAEFGSRCIDMRVAIPENEVSECIIIKESSTNIPCAPPVKR